MASDSVLRVVFMGSPDFAVPTLEALDMAADIDVVLVCTRPARPSGRGKRVTKTAVESCTDRLDISALGVSKGNYKLSVAKIESLAPDAVVVAAFGVILRSDLLDLPRLGCVNLHASLLPRHRGMSPIQAAILAGDEETGCTTMQMDEGVDTGDILMEARLPIAEDDTAGTLEAKLATLGAPLMVDTLRGLRDGNITPRRQDDGHATYAKRIRKEHGHIDWSQGAEDVDRRIRAMTPWPSAYTSVAGKRIIIERARKTSGSGRPGDVLSTSPLVVAAGEGAIELIQLKVAGKKSMSAKAFLAGYRLEAGARFGSDAQK